jgi:hypothetical protein
MFWCYVCGSGEPLFSEFRVHINRHACNYEMTMPIRCCQSSCRSTFTKAFNFFRHVKCLHADDEQSCSLAKPSSSKPKDCASHPDGINEQSHANCVPDIIPAVVSKSPSSVLSDIMLEGSTLVASLRANSSIPYNVIPQIIDSVNEISQGIVSACHTEAVKCFAKCTDESPSMVSKFASDLEQNLGKMSKPLQFLVTKYKQDSYFTNHPAFVSPHTINFGMRLETVRGKTKTVYDTFEYVPVRESLTALFHNEQFVHSFFKTSQRDADADVIEHFSDGELAKNTLYFQSLTVHLS